MFGTHATQTILSSVSLFVEDSLGFGPIDLGSTSSPKGLHAGMKWSIKNSPPALSEDGTESVDRDWFGTRLNKPFALLSSEGIMKADLSPSETLAAET